MDGWPGDATFFLWGQPLKIIRMYSAKKGPAPWILFLTPAPRPLQVTFLVGEAEHMWLSKKKLFQGHLCDAILQPLKKNHMFCIVGAR